jgi:opacity protein-like surface antigen
MLLSAPRHGAPLVVARTVACISAFSLTVGVHAADLLGAYAGAAVGDARVEANVPSVGDFKRHHSAFELTAGIRPISLIGAELSYIDFGHPRDHISTVGTVSTDVTEKGAAAFGVVYLPLPVPVVDVFLKAGIARLQSTLKSSRIGVATCTVTSPNCGLIRLDTTNAGFAAGAGAQLKFGSLAVRAEYERFSAAGGNPSLLSLGLLWTFL